MNSETERPGGSSSQPLSRTQEILRRDARDLELLNQRVRRLLGQLPATTGGEGDDLPDEPDPTTALRADLQCILADHLEPAARALQAVARQVRLTAEPGEILPPRISS